MEAATELLDVIDSDQTVSLDNAGDDGRTIFHHAVIQGRPEPIKELIETLKKKNYSIDYLQNILDREVTMQPVVRRRYKVVRFGIIF